MDRPALELTRDEIFFEVKRRKRFDVVIVGGGIHGAAVARVCALNGLSVLLCEKNDYASQTSSRSSKMAHGGLRYLEMFDFPQVFEGIKAREELFQAAPHLVRPAQFVIPSELRSLGDKWYSLKLQCGLTLYDLFLKDKSRAHSLVHNVDGLPSIASRPSAHFLYTDGIMNDTRVVIENILSARQEGALCLNYCEVKSLHQGAGGEHGVGIIDRVTGTSYELRAGIIVNCAGPHVARVGRLKAAPIEDKIRFSRGTHLLFNFPWKYPPLFLPIDRNASRYYWVWPHESGTLVGTTESEVKGPIENPLPTVDEMQEILARVQKDLPQEPFSKENIHYAFAGVRTLPKKGDGPTGKLSRRHLLTFDQGVISLVGGKFTTASWTADEILAKIWKEAKLKDPPTRVGARPLPGGVTSDDTKAEIRDRLKAFDYEDAFDRVYARWGRRARKVVGDSALVPVLDKLFDTEIALSVMEEQPIAAADILSRRVGTVYESDFDPSSAIEKVGTALKSEVLGGEFAQKVNDELVKEHRAIKELIKNI
jgi:glycerol-3-phosphate dehydrogenase